MTAAVGYLRVSSEEQAEDGFSLAAQERAIRLYCELHGIHLTECFIDDGYSGTKAERPAFKRLLAAAENRTFQTVIVHKFDRWARNTELLLHTIRRLSELDITFVSISEQVDCSTPAGKMMLTIIASTAQFHSDNLSVEVRKGILEKVQQGLWHGPYPIGYRKGPDGVLVETEDAPIVKLSFQLYATGQYSFLDLARELNRRGYRIYNVQKGVHVLFDKWNVLSMLKNEVYRGFVKYNKQLFPGRHEPLVDQATWDAVQQVIARHAGKRGRVSIRSDRTGGGMLTETVYCERCGQPMYYSPTKSRAGKSYCYYRCAGRDKLTCQASLVRSEEVDAQMREVIKALSLPRDLRDAVLARLEQLLGDDPPEQTPERVALEQQRSVLENARMCGLIVGDVYEAKRREIEEKLAALPKPENQGLTMNEVREAAVLLDDMARLIDEAPIPEQRGIVRSIFDGIWVTAHQVCAIMPNNLYLPLVSVASRHFEDGEPGGDRTHDPLIKSQVLCR
jgi:site-specific DNA recombinase